MADVKLTIEEANALVEKIVSWATKAKDDNAPMDWRDMLTEAHKLEQKVERAGLEKFAREQHWKKFRPDSPDRH